MVYDPHFVETCLKAVPGDPVVRLGNARLAIINGRIEEAETTLPKLSGTTRRRSRRRRGWEETCWRSPTGRVPALASRAPRVCG